MLCSGAKTTSGSHVVNEFTESIQERRMEPDKKLLSKELVTIEGQLYDKF